jgi:hypothetical protein
MEKCSISPLPVLPPTARLPLLVSVEVRAR